MPFPRLSPGPRLKKTRLSLAILTATTVFGLSSVAQAQVPIIQPGAPGQASRVITAEEASNLADLSYSLGDIQFLARHDSASRAGEGDVSAGGRADE